MQLTPKHRSGVTFLFLSKGEAISISTFFIFRKCNPVTAKQARETQSLGSGSLPFRDDVYKTPFVCTACPSQLLPNCTLAGWMGCGVEDLMRLAIGISVHVPVAIGMPVPIRVAVGIAVHVSIAICVPVSVGSRSSVGLTVHPLHTLDRILARFLHDTVLLLRTHGRHPHVAFDEEADEEDCQRR